MGLLVPRGRNTGGLRVATAVLAIVTAVTSAWVAGCASSPLPQTKIAAFVAPTSDDQVSIYDVVVRRDCSDYFRDGELPKVLYIVRREAAVVDGMPAPASDEMMIPTDVQYGLLQSLANLGPEVRWTDTSAGVRGDMATGGAVDGGRGAIVELGRIAYSSATKATVYASIYAGNVGASGRTYTLERVNGVWRVTGTTGVEWVS